ncbi:hypothetical protein ACFQU7_16355 [Pseudoroseomonas wenyumeiae]
MLLLNHLAAALPTSELAAEPAERLAAAAASLYAHAAQRRSGEAKLRLLPPAPARAARRWPRSSPTTCPSWWKACWRRWRSPVARRGGCCTRCCAPGAMPRAGCCRSAARKAGPRA